MSYPYLPLYCDALLGDFRVQSLTFEERSAWVLILVYLWQAEGYLDDSIIPKILQCPPEIWHPLKNTFIKIGLLHVTEKGLSNHRITKELLKNEYLSNIRRKSAEKMHKNRLKRLKKQ